MTDHITPIDQVLHRNLRVDVRSIAGAANDRFVQVVTREFELLAVHYPIMLSKDADTGEFYCGAMLGIDPGENLFTSGPRALSSYRPLDLQRVPFFAIENGLAVDMGNPHVGKDDKGELLFEEDGTSTPFLRSVAIALDILKKGLIETRGFIDTMLSRKLVTPIDISLTFDDGSSREIEGLYTIDREAMAALSDTAIINLFRAGYLQSAYAMIGSVRQIPVLAARKNDRLAGVDM